MTFIKYYKYYSIKIFAHNLINANLHDYAYSTLNNAIFRCYKNYQDLSTLCIA